MAWRDQNFIAELFYTFCDILVTFFCAQARSERVVRVRRGGGLDYDRLVRSGSDRSRGRRSDFKWDVLHLVRPSAPAPHVERL